MYAGAGAGAVYSVPMCVCAYVHMCACVPMRVCVCVHVPGSEGPRLQLDYNIALIQTLIYDSSDY